LTLLFRSELTSFLDEFAEHHRGVRRGKMFGLPAIYVGRRLVTCLIEDGLIVRLPNEVAKREIRARKAKAFSRKGREVDGWVLYQPRTATVARGLTPIVETGVRYIAERQTEEITGIRIKRRTR
jgi:hypothetical protein